MLTLLNGILGFFSFTYIKYLSHLPAVPTLASNGASSSSSTSSICGPAAPSTISSDGGGTSVKRNWTNALVGGTSTFCVICFCARVCKSFPRPIVFVCGSGCDCGSVCCCSCGCGGLGVRDSSDFGPVSVPSFCLSLVLALALPLALPLALRLFDDIGPYKIKLLVYFILFLKFLKCAIQGNPQLDI